MEIEIEETFEMAHRLQQHDGRCRFLHGHSYALRLTVAGMVRDREGGMLVDFKTVRGFVRDLTDDVLDHACALERGDPYLAIVTGDAGDLNPGWYRDRRVLVLPVPPTAEMLAYVALGFLTDRLKDTKRSVASVSVRETARAWAHLRPFDDVTALSSSTAFTFGEWLSQKGGTDAPGL